ncbi:MAG: hypothetical protein IJ567_09650 [Lachnospiraceae bacterium]|nr:hypothetical protein [Lachnospiraceae bacterium]
MLKKTMKKLIKILTNNFILKIVALMSAIALWIVVMNVDDPTQSGYFTATVNIENAGYMAEQGKYFEIPDTSMTVRFKVTAIRSVMKNLSNSDFKAVADMEEIEQTEDGYRVPLTITATRYATAVKFGNAVQYVYVNVENLATKQFTIKAVSSGEPAENCAVGDLDASPNVLKVSGPESVVNQVETVQATVNVTGASANLTDSVAPVLYDTDGNPVDSSRLTFNINSITVSVKILDVRSIPVEVSVTGDAGEGYAYTQLLVDPEKVRIKGSAAALNAADKVVIPSDLINISGTTENVVRMIDITGYLPAGVELADANERNVEITVVIEPYVTNTYEVPVSRITAENVPDGYQLTFSDDTVSVDVTGLESDMDAFTIETLTAAIDLSGVGEGVHQLSVNWQTESEAYTVNSGGTVQIELKREQQTEENDAQTGTDQNSNNAEETGNTI